METYGEVLGKLPNLEYHAVIDSTNLRAKELARAGIQDGFSVFADAQTAGRGRMQRQWVSEQGRGIWMTRIVRPVNIPAERASELSFVAAKSVMEAIEENSDCRLDLKWPNDLLCRDKKICGIMAEMAPTAGGLIDWAVVGIGINVLGTQFPDLPYAGSVESTRGRKIERSVLAQTLLRALESNLQLWGNRGFAPILDACAARMITLGKHVLALRDGEPVEGIAVGMDPDGALQLQTKEKMLHLRYGEVSIRGMGGYVDEKDHDSGVK